MSLKMGHVGTKSRSPGQILEKPFVRSRAHIFGPIFLKLDQDLFLNDILDEIENGSCWVKKTRSPGQILEKNIVHATEATFSVQYS